MRILALIFIALLSAACSKEPQSIINSQEYEFTTFAQSVEDLSTPPTSKEMIRALLSLQSLKLSVAPSCRAVAVDFTDTTLGDFMSGMFAEMNEPKGKPLIQTSVEETESYTGEPVWQCSVVMRYNEKDHRKVRRVSYQLRAMDRSLIKESIQCMDG